MKRRLLFSVLILAGILSVSSLNFSEKAVRQNQEGDVTETGSDHIRLNAVDADRSDKSEFTNSIGMKFVLISPGTFMMGSPPDEPGRFDRERLHRVTLTKGFYMQTTEVTQGQWKAVMGNNPSEFKNCGNNCPVEKVSWDDVREFIKKLNRKEGAGKYRLPTEAEWEYACRAGTDTPFSFGRCLSTDQANYWGEYFSLPGCPKGEDRGKTVSVASFPANSWGLYDMHGNIHEWCQDTFGTDTYARDQTDPIYMVGSDRVLRGGSWFSFARICRSADRRNLSPDSRGSNFGFRLARTYQRRISIEAGRKHVPVCGPDARAGKGEALCGHISGGCEHTDSEHPAPVSALQERDISVHPQAEYELHYIGISDWPFLCGCAG
ncbi:formylglycine-generating enzyme family protein [Desulfobacterales bacterium HSG2]|nr:formylglycine-generating enzyme family protein [Desulfobacterales bacterium HSG2]